MAPQLTNHSDYLFDTSEQEAAVILNVCWRTAATYRRNGRLPSYLYRNCGTDKRPWFRYNTALLMRWRDCPPEEREKEEILAKEIIEKYWKSQQQLISKPQLQIDR